MYASFTFTATYRKTEGGFFCCEVQNEITSQQECKLAGESLGLYWAHAWNGPDDFPACLYAANRNGVYYNLSPNPNRITFNPKYSAICKSKGRHFFLVLTIHCIIFKCCLDHKYPTSAVIIFIIA